MEQSSKYTTNSILKLYDWTDAELAKEFLIKKYRQKITLDVIADEIDKYKLDENSDGTKKYPKICALPNTDYSFLVYRLYKQYDMLCRDTNRCDINIESIMKHYENLLSENWEVYDHERLVLDKEFAQKGRPRNATPKSNAYILQALTDVINSIDLTKSLNTSNI